VSCIYMDANTLTHIDIDMHSYIYTYIYIYVYVRMYGKKPKT
jgi:hypothetical protein